ncbi:MAG: hypothetical protein HDS25_06440 [Bacteroides sp.]|nr:hypothetical protein [Bacteroides sp.]
MKRLLFILLILPFVALCYGKVKHMGYSESGIVIEYDFSDFTSTPDPADPSLSHFIVQGCSIMKGEGLPALPFKGESFEIPKGITLGEIQIEEITDTIIGKCAPARLFYSDSEPIPTTNENNIIPYDGIWPSTSACLGETGTYRDRQIGKVIIYPVRYDYNNEMAVVSKRLKITIPFINSPVTYNLSEDESEHSLPKDMFSAYCPLNLQVSNEVTPVGSAYQPPVLLPTLMMVTPKRFEEPIRTFAKWKQRMGYSVYIEVVSDESKLLDPNYTKSLITNRYKTDKNLEYVLLVGGGDIIRPCEGKYTVKFDNVTNPRKVYTDFYFCCMDGDNDFTPDLVIGRFPAHNVEDLNAMISKTMHYEKNPPVSYPNFYQTGIHIGEWEDQAKSTGKAGFERRNFIWTSEWFRNQLITNFGLDVKRLYYKYSTATPTHYANGIGLTQDLKDYFLTNNLTTSQINGAINTGALYILARCHGGVSVWTNLGYNENYVRNLINLNRLSFVYAVNCNSGIIYNPEIKAEQSRYIDYSLCEEFLRNNHGGAVCALGANGESDSDYNDFLAAAIFNATYVNSALGFEIPNALDFMNQFGLFSEFGKICQAAIENMVVQADGYSVIGKRFDQARYNRECYNCLGDPTVRFNISAPIIKDAEHLRTENNEARLDPRMIVDARLDQLTFGYSNLALWGPEFLGKDADGNERDLTGYSLIGDGYVPILLEEYQESHSLSKPIISSIKGDDSNIFINLTGPTTNTYVCLYDIYGNRVNITEVSNESMIVPKPNGMSIITLEKDGVILDSAKLHK